MRMKSLILIFIALGCGLVASIGISQVMNRGGGGGSMEMEQILVALTDIDIGTKLDAQNVKLEDWPKAKIPEGADPPAGRRQGQVRQRPVLQGRADPRQQDLRHSSATSPPRCRKAIGRCP